MKLKSISYLGPEGTYTHKVAEQRFKTSVNFVPCRSVQDVFDSLVDGRAHAGIVPIENTSGGTIYETVDALVIPSLMSNNTTILEQLSIEVQLALLAQKGAKITDVYSHPAALIHCMRWIKDNLPGAHTHEVASTALAAEKAAGSKDGVAAIASKVAAEQYGLDILEYPLSNDKRNVTQFFLLGSKNDETQETSDMPVRTTITFELLDSVGALHGLLEPFAKNNVNLTRILSRPLPGQPGKYIFLACFEGDSEDPAVAGVLSDAATRCGRLVILGSYPVRKPYQS